LARKTPRERDASQLPLSTPLSRSNLACYVPTDIWETRESSYSPRGEATGWQWRRVNEWFRQLQEDDHYKSFEKKHLLKGLI
jgi:hypothetical protein